MGLHITGCTQLWTDCNSLLHLSNTLGLYHEHETTFMLLLLLLVSDPARPLTDRGHEIAFLKGFHNQDTAMLNTVVMLN